MWLQLTKYLFYLSFFLNIVCGVWFLSYLYDYCGESWPAALTCWRWGPGHGETSEYASTVLAGAEKWR